MSNAEIYTDGSIYPNPGTGGYAAVINLPDKSIVVQGKAHPTTNNRMEMRAVLEGLRSCPEVDELRIYCDSEYVVKTIQERLDFWVRTGKTVSNGDLWIKIWKELQKRQSTFLRIHHIRGHSGSYWNDVADQLANDARISTELECVTDTPRTKYSLK